MDTRIRRRVAELATDLSAGKLTYEEFFDLLPEETDDTEDEEIAELLDLIEHEPQVGFLWASKEEHDRHMARIEELIHRLKVIDE
ncbi:MAG: hypothetical protein KY468_15780 [Armatimonadetes bacterium]|nr:hypothetical protein [Armatimonadota bacterium]